MPLLFVADKRLSLFGRCVGAVCISACTPTSKAESRTQGITGCLAGYVLHLTFSGIWQVYKAAKQHGHTGRPPYFKQGVTRSPCCMLLFVVVCSLARRV
jgi:hypothetical protein